MLRKKKKSLLLWLSTEQRPNATKRQRAFFELPWSKSLLCIFWIHLKKKNKNKTKKEIKTRDEQSLFTPMSVMSGAISYLIIHIEKRLFFVLISFPPKRLRPCPKKITRLCLWFIWKAVIGQLQTPFKIFLWYLKAHFRTKVSFNSFLRVSPVITIQWWAVYIWMSGKTLL